MKFIKRLEDVQGLMASERLSLKKVTSEFDFCASEYYLSLIDWDDPNDPIKRVIIPHKDELEKWGELDPSHESDYTIMPGLQHKYHSTALFLVSGACAGFCRYCFRKRIFVGGVSGILENLQAALRYVNSHKEITNVLLTGGDPLMLSTSELQEIIMPLMAMDHIQIVRIGTKVPNFNPSRINPELLSMIDQCRYYRKKLYIITHFSHTRELTGPAIAGLNNLQTAGAVLANQTPLIRGVNDDPDTLAKLLNKLSFIGVPPYYVFQCRPATGNKAYAVPIEEGCEIFNAACAQVSGLAKRVRFVMSHATGKIEILGKQGDDMCFKYHRAAKDEDSGRVMICKSNPDAYWFDDYREELNG